MVAYLYLEENEMMLCGGKTEHLKLAFFGFVFFSLKAVRSKSAKTGISFLSLLI